MADLVLGRANGRRFPLWNAATMWCGVMAGIAWGLTMGIGLPLMGALEHGVICLSDIALTTAISTMAGIVTIGPLAALAPPSRRSR